MWKALLQDLGWPMEMILWHSDNISPKWGELHNRILARRWKLFTDAMEHVPNKGKNDTEGFWLAD